MNKQINIMWFRQDLRLRDNPALREACSDGSTIALYILDDKNPQQYAMGEASKWWLHHSLEALNKSLDGKLHIRKGDPHTILTELIDKTGAAKVVWNRCYEPWQIKRDKGIKQQLKQQDVLVRSFNGSLLWEPWEIMNKAGSVYKVFTPYYRKGCLQAPSPRSPVDAPKDCQYEYLPELDQSLDNLQLIPQIEWYQAFPNHCQPGEEGAANNLSHFLSEPVASYKEARDVPSKQGTSRLSGHLHFGEISPHQVWYAALNKYAGSMENPDLDCFLSELGWREFSHYLLFHFPTLPEKNYNSTFDSYQWRDENSDLVCWQQGQTGVPIVDAGMRELWQTGYMHNRVRMVVGSYLVKNLQTHWQHGERWFWDCLVDADLAANSASWQWVAGSGADASPFFRIFNPVTQGERFDSQGIYVRKYCPELDGLPDKYIHKPWEAPADILAKANLVLGKHYPKPLVDLKVSRQQALDAYANAKDSQPSQPS
ncbi:deoxyribodipyrimidine photo-lyase [Aliiglaciecola sp. LCG003]|uniref:cryptochrome/photolyase family protein n=1 Tax=Aliiglaciecola sp. LCG003 TaxID=3053655 RepID=UPI0025736B95|nr:deoxyribodipyrimidine photo-lyase [Aliiglaciecola sp. LCG003]WJG10330.1 deoxyribodipyrimidine photo-lyase [Aliiglaciecola sp. LCG003]